MCGEGQGNIREAEYHRNCVDIEDYTEEQKLSVFCPTVTQSFKYVTADDITQDALTDPKHDFSSDSEFLSTILNLALDEDHHALGVILGKGIKARLLEYAERYLNGEVF